MGTQTELLERTERIRAFLRLLYGDHERVYFFALMKDETWKQWEDPQRLAQFPRYVGNIPVRWGCNGDNEVTDIACDGSPPRQRFRLAVASAAVGSTQLHRTIAKLDQFAKLGYGIYFTANPLIHPRRLKATVRQIRYLVIEADEMSMQEQQQALDLLKPDLRCAVWTGGRSIHMYLPLRRPIWNPKRLSTRHYARSLRYDDAKQFPDIEIPELSKLVGQVRTFLDGMNFKYDPNVLSPDFSRLVRVPYFPHDGTGKLAEVVYANPNSDIGLDDFAPTLCGTFLSNRTQSESPISNDVSFIGNNDGGLGESSISDTSYFDWKNDWGSILGSAGQYGGVGRGEFFVYTGKTMIHTGRQSAPTPARFRPFLDDLHEFTRLKMEGIPERGFRTKGHYALFTAKRVYGWTDVAMQQVWRDIVMMNPANIGCSIEQAVADIGTHWERSKGKSKNPSLPDMTKLPPTTNRTQTLVGNLTKMGCPWPADVAKIILKVLMAPIQGCPKACIDGRAAIRAKDLQRACSSRSYKAAREWMAAHNILVLKNPSYIRGVHSMTYFVNVHLILFLLGFRSDELVWSGVTERRKAA